MKLEARLLESNNQTPDTLILEFKVEKAVLVLSNLAEIYQKADINRKREIIGSIYPEKFEFSENNYRTTQVNEIAALICHINSTLIKKAGTFDDKSSKFRLVPLSELISNRFFDDLEKIFRLEIVV